MDNQFPPLTDKKRFPLLCSLSDQLNHALMVCDGLVFFAPQDSSAANSATRMPGGDWHLYGDTRWPSFAAWIEFQLTHHSFLDRGGVLVVRAKLPSKASQPFEWIAGNHPLHNILPQMRTTSVMEAISTMLHTQFKSSEVIAGPTDESPAYVQSYCIYQQAAGKDDVRFVATYTDILNSAGVIIPRYRTADANEEDFSLCRFSLHSVFRLNAARLEGMLFITHSQSREFAPAHLSGDVIPPKWMNFHPSRTLRVRRAVRALPSPTLRNALMEMSDYEVVIGIRRREANAHMLAFGRLARPREMALFNTDTNATMTAFVHRAHGGAIYVIPDALVEEFDHTDCSEVRVGDISLPFASIFLKFTPPETLWLDEGARVDGCYIGKQGDEFLLTVTSRIDGVDYENSMSVACMDPIFALHVPTSDPELDINSAVDVGINAFLQENEPPAENFTGDVERPDGTMARVEDIRARSRKGRIERFRSQEPVFRACLNIIVNAACFIAFRPDDIDDAWEGEPSPEVLAAVNAAGDSRRVRDRKLGALRKLDHGDFTRVKICGRDLFTDGEERSADGAEAKSPRAHWRRGHWRRQRHGVGLSLIVLRWIRPTIVRSDHGSLVEARIYDVDRSARP
jgi:hypothetical protein